jgi:DNA-directed RNA polymerase I and III subunit RPAC1
MNQAVVSRALDCSLCRECIRPPGWEARIQLSRVKDEFLFTIESTGILSPEDLFKEALKVLTDKCSAVTAVLQGAGEA